MLPTYSRMARLMTIDGEERWVLNISAIINRFNSQNKAIIEITELAIPDSSDLYEKRFVKLPEKQQKRGIHTGQILKKKGSYYLEVDKWQIPLRFRLSCNFFGEDVKRIRYTFKIISRAGTE